MVDDAVRELPAPFSCATMPSGVPVPAGPMPDTSFEAWTSRWWGGLPETLGRVPFTLIVVLLTLLGGLVARTVFTPIWQLAWFRRWRTAYRRCARGGSGRC